MKQFILNEYLYTLKDCKCVIDNYANVYTWYTLGETVDLLNDLSKENKQLKMVSEEEKETVTKLTNKNQKLVLENLQLEMIIKSGKRKIIERNKRWIDDAGTLVDTVTGEKFNTVKEIVDTLNYYEEICLRYKEDISELKNGTYKEPLPITQRK